MSDIVDLEAVRARRGLLDVRIEDTYKGGASCEATEIFSKLARRLGNYQYILTSGNSRVRVPCRSHLKSVK